MLNETEHLLVCLNEECAEIAKRLDKALRFGIDDKDPTYEGAPTERARITEECHHFMAVFEMLFERGILPTLVDRAAMDTKKTKVLKFMEYAREHGALEPDKRQCPRCGSALLDNNECSNTMCPKY